MLVLLSLSCPTMCLCTLLVKMSHSSAPSVGWCADRWSESVKWVPHWQHLLTLSNLAHKGFSVTFALIVMQSTVIVIPWAFCECFCPRLKSISPFCFHYLHGKTVFIFGNNGCEAVKQACNRIIQHTMATTTHSCSPCHFLLMLNFRSQWLDWPHCL